MVFFNSKQRLLHQNCKSLWVPALICGLCMQNSEFGIRITSLYESQISPTVFCIQNSAFCTRIASLCGSQPSSVVFASKTANSGTRITSLYWSQTSSVDLWMKNSVLRSRMSLVNLSQPSSVVLCTQNSDFSTRIASLYGCPIPHLWFLHVKQRLLGSELQVSMGPRLRRWLICEWKTALLSIQNVACLYCSQPSSVVLCIHNSDIMSRINSLYGSQTTPVDLCMQNSVISTRITSLHVS